MAKRPGKIQTFFNTDSDVPDATRQGSLTELIARQLEQKLGNQQEDTAPEAKSSYPSFTVGSQQAFLLYQQAYKRVDQSNQQGNYLNEVDGKTGNGLEHLLPNANTRFGVAHHRLEKEISSIRAKIHDYELVLQSALGSQKTNLKESIYLLKSRLATLERRFYKVSLSLAQVEEQTHPIRSSFKRPWLQMELWLKEGIHYATQQLGLPAESFNPFKSAKTREKEGAYQTLLQAKTLLEAETQKTNPSAETISSLVFRYEKALKNYQNFINAANNG